MAQSPGTLRVGRYFLSLILILVALYGLVFLPGYSHTPKLGLDLEGGAQVIFRAKTTNGKAPSKSSMKVAQQIFISEKTVGRHLANIYAKLDVSSRTAAVTWAYQSGVIAPED